MGLELVGTRYVTLAGWKTHIWSSSSFLNSLFNVITTTSQISLGAAKLLVASLEENKKDSSQNGIHDLCFNPSVFAPENRGVREATAFSWVCHQRWKDRSGGI